jgi:hypothetical protein
MTAVSSVVDAPTVSEGLRKWEYLVVPLQQEVKGMKGTDPGREPDRLNELGAQGWEAVGLSLKYGDLIAWPVVLLKRPAH